MSRWGSSDKETAYARSQDSSGGYDKMQACFSQMQEKLLQELAHVISFGGNADAIFDAATTFWRITEPRSKRTAELRGVDEDNVVTNLIGPHDERWGNQYPEIFKKVMQHVAPDIRLKLRYLDDQLDDYLSTQDGLYAARITEATQKGYVADKLAKARYISGGIIDGVVLPFRVEFVSHWHYSDELLNIIVHSILPGPSVRHRRSHIYVQKELKVERDWDFKKYKSALLAETWKILFSHPDFRDDREFVRYKRNFDIFLHKYIHDGVPVDGIDLFELVRDTAEVAFDLIQLMPFSNGTRRIAEVVVRAVWQCMGFTSGAWAYPHGVSWDFWALSCLSVKDYQQYFQSAVMPTLARLPGCRLGDEPYLAGSTVLGVMDQCHPTGAFDLLKPEFRYLVAYIGSTSVIRPLMKFLFSVLSSGGMLDLPLLTDVAVSSPSGLVERLCLAVVLHPGHYKDTLFQDVGTVVQSFQP